MYYNRDWTTCLVVYIKAFSHSFSFFACFISSRIGSIKHLGREKVETQNYQAKISLGWTYLRKDLRISYSYEYHICSFHANTLRWLTDENNVRVQEVTQLCAAMGQGIHINYQSFSFISETSQQKQTFKSAWLTCLCARSDD